MSYMTKKEAVAEFKSFILPQVKATYEQDGIPDRPARREAWNNYTDALCKSRRISDRQYNNWLHPRIVDPS